MRSDPHQIAACEIVHAQVIPGFGTFLIPRECQSRIRSDAKPFFITDRGVQHTGRVPRFGSFQIPRIGFLVILLRAFPVVIAICQRHHAGGVPELSPFQAPIEQLLIILLHAPAVPAAIREKKDRLCVALLRGSLQELDVLRFDHILLGDGYERRPVDVIVQLVILP